MENTQHAIELTSFSFHDIDMHYAHLSQYAQFILKALHADQSNLSEK